MNTPIAASALTQIKDKRLCADCEIAGSEDWHCQIKQSREFGVASISSREIIPLEKMSMSPLGH